MNRRRFLALAGGGAAVLAGGGGYGAWRLLEPGGGPGARSFRSRPDLRPPVVEVERRGVDEPAGYVFVAPMGGPGQTGALVFDDDGDPVWFRPSPHGAAVMDLRVQRYRGAPVLTWWEGHVAHGYGQGDGVLVDASYREIARVRGGNGHRPDLHELQLTPEGTALVTSYQVVPRDLRAVGGPRNGQVVDGIVLELDVATGDVLLEWHSLDHVPPTESRRTPGDGSSPFDYFHANSIDVDADGHLLVSARHTCAVYKLHRRTGAVIWRLGGTRSDFRLGPGAAFNWQHDARSRPGGTLTIFDDGASPKVEPQSRAIVVALDERARTARLVRAYTDGLLATAMGSMQTLPGGSVFVGWGTQPVATEFALDGATRFRARLPSGAISYRAYRFGWRGAPRDAPALAARPAGGDVSLAVSWNGATEVALWRVAAGAAPGSLAAVADVPRRGFETRFRLPGRYRYAAVTALDRAGSPLGRSATVALA